MVEATDREDKLDTPDTMDPTEESFGFPPSCGSPFNFAPASEAKMKLCYSKIVEAQHIQPSLLACYHHCFGNSITLFAIGALM